MNGDHSSVYNFTQFKMINNASYDDHTIRFFICISPSPGLTYSRFHSSLSLSAGINGSILRISFSLSRNHKTNTGVKYKHWSQIIGQQSGSQGRGSLVSRGVNTDTHNPASFQRELIIKTTSINNKSQEILLISFRAIASFYMKTKSLSRNFFWGKT